MTEQQKLSNSEPPQLTPSAEITHPNDPSSVIGHLSGEDDAVLYRRRADHYFRKYGGYAVSQKVINALERVGVESIFIEEQDTSILLEYGLGQFSSGETIYYDTRENTIVPELAGRGGRHESVGRYDAQKVVPESEATTWEEFTIADASDARDSGE